MPRGVNDYDTARIQGRNVSNANSYSIVSPGLVTDGLLLHFDAGNFNSYPIAGTIWYDISNNLKNGTLTNGPTFSSVNGGAIVFDGSNDYVALGNGVINTNANNTFGFWVSFDVINKIHTLTSGMNTSGPYQIRADTNNNIQLIRGNLALIGTFSGFTISATTNYHIVVRRISNTYDLYVNGEYKSSITSTQTFNTNDQAFAANGGIGAEYLDGNLYAINFYNRALTPTEVAQNFNATRARFGI
jgi:hypothetical protein